MVGDRREGGKEGVVALPAVRSLQCRMEILPGIVPRRVDDGRKDRLSIEF